MEVWLFMTVLPKSLEYLFKMIDRGIEETAGQNRDKPQVVTP